MAAGLSNPPTLRGVWGGVGEIRLVDRALREYRGAGAGGWVGVPRRHAAVGEIGGFTKGKSAIRALETFPGSYGPAIGLGGVPRRAPRHISGAPGNALDSVLGPEFVSRSLIRIRSAILEWTSDADALADQEI